MPSRKYLPICPAASMPRDGVSSAWVSRRPMKDLVGKRIVTQVACTECRGRKIRCDGGQPMCSNCIKMALSSCVYEKRETTKKLSQEALDLLRSISQDRAFDFLTALRNKGDLPTVLSIFKKGIRPLPPDDADTDSSKHSPGPSPTAMELELMTKNSKAYPALHPIPAFILANSKLLCPLQSTVPLNLKDLSDTIGQPNTATSSVDHSTAPLVDADSAIRQFRLSTAPTPQCDYCDERLRNLDITFWTGVGITNDFAARVISLYIKTDHPLLGLFDPHLFITDLVGRQTKFCSKFLIHALMYLGCQMYSAFDTGAIEVADRFCHEAELLWIEEKENPSYLNMAGAALLSLSLMGHGKDHVLPYSMAAARMGTWLGLFESTDIVPPRVGEETTEDERSASRYAAWGVFNWTVFLSLLYRQPDSDGSYNPPSLPIPGEEFLDTPPFDLPEEFHSTIRVLMGSTFPTLCQFWRIIHGARWNNPPETLKLVLAEYKFRELIAWVEGLPPSMVRRQESPHHVAVFYIWLHATILDILRPFIGKPLDQRPRMKTFSASDNFADNAYAASVSQLKRLVVDYRTNYETSTYSILWHTGLISLANSMLQNTDDPEWRLYFLLCIYGYEILRRPYRISEVIVQGLLAMTLRDTNMSGGEARQIMKELKERGLSHAKKNVEGRIRATFMVDLRLALTDPVNAMAENMADEFNNLALFQECIHQDQIER